MIEFLRTQLIQFDMENFFDISTRITVVVFFFFLSFFVWLWITFDHFDDSFDSDVINANRWFNGLVFVFFTLLSRTSDTFDKGKKKKKNNINNSILDWYSLLFIYSYAYMLCVFVAKLKKEKKKDYMRNKKFVNFFPASRSLLFLLHSASISHIFCLNNFTRLCLFWPFDLDANGIHLIGLTETRTHLARHSLIHSDTTKNHLIVW